MKRVQLCVFAVLIAASSFTACKSKNKGDAAPAATVSADSTPAEAPAMPSAAPVVIANDDALKAGLNDALKDYSSVKGEVADSIINVSGTIKKADWQKLVQTLNSLHPKRINSNNLTIK